MSALRYLCLSDMHLGAAYSLLTHIDSEGAVRPEVASATLKTLATGLRHTVAELADAGTPPTLVLMGDVLDLGLSPMGQVSHAFMRFVDALFPAQGPQLFAPRILCLAGNHDHHLWRVAQDEHYLNGLSGIEERHIAEDLTQTLPLFNPPQLTCTMLTRLLHLRPHLADCRVDIAYPNLGLANADGTRAVVLHHGHYVDSMYRAMSRLNSWLSGHDWPPATVAQIERENGPWVDFLWSDLGSAGGVGRDALTLYETMLDAGASHTLANTMSARLLKQIGARYGVRAETELTHGVTVGGVVRGLVDLAAGQAADSQRDGYRQILSSDEVADLRWYLGGPVAQQLREEERLNGLRELSFVFGHTHKPFQDQLAITPYATPVAVYNTGGWVMDQPTLMSRQGAAAMLIDDEMNVASLRLFNDAVNGEMAWVHAGGIGGFRDAANPLLAQLTDSIERNGKDWAAFSACAKNAMDKRAGQVLARLFHPEVANIQSTGSAT